MNCLREKSHSGFTLIELMVVLAIAALGVSLVTPHMVRNYENFRISAEERKLGEMLASVRMKAFFRSAVYHVKLEDHIFLMVNEKVQVNFGYITFPPQQFTVNEHGFSDMPQVRYHISGKPGIKTAENTSDGL